MVIEILTVIIILLIVGVATSLRAYFVKKGENQALLEDTKKLTEEIESVKNKFETKRYKYQEKFKIYKQYFELIDIHHKKATNGIQEKFLPIISDFNEQYLMASEKEDKQAESAAITKFSNNVMILTTEMNNELMRLRHETNSLKLIASSAILEQIELLDSLNEKMFDISSKIMSSMNTIEYMQNKEIPEILIKESDRILSEINECRTNVRNLMKMELELE